MSQELSNLLPKQYTKTFRRRYFFRLGTVALIIVAFLIALHGIFLIPSYIFMAEDSKARSQELQALSKNQQTAEEQKVGDLQKSLQAETGYLLTFRNTPTVSSVLRSVLAVPHDGIVLTGFVYATPTKSQQGNLQVQGLASTREALRSYDEALAALPYVTKADLPISAYADANNISFTITLTGSLKP